MYPPSTHAHLPLYQLVKLILTVSGKDLTAFMEQWVCRGGVPRFHASFTFIRKKNIIELKLKQDTSKGQPSFVVSESQIF